MYKIIISVNNNEEVWTLPHCPPDFPIPQPEQHHETYEGLSRDYRRIGTLSLRHMEWTALLPVRRYFVHAVRVICGRLGICRFLRQMARQEGAVPADRARQQGRSTA